MLGGGRAARPVLLGGLGLHGVIAARRVIVFEEVMLRLPLLSESGLEALDHGVLLLDFGGEDLLDAFEIIGLSQEPLDFGGEARVVLLEALEQTRHLAYFVLAQFLAV